MVIEKDMFRSRHRRCSVTKDVIRKFSKFTGKHLCQRLFLNKVASAACNFNEKEALAQVFSYEFYEISKNAFFAEYLQTTAFSFMKEIFSIGQTDRLLREKCKLNLDIPSYNQAT